MTARSGTVLFRGLFDDAAIFPPGNVPLPEAVAAYRTRQSPLVGSFVCALPRWAELTAALAAPPTGGAALPVSLTVPGGAEQIPEALARAAAESRAELVALEVPATADGLDKLDRQIVPTYVELPWANITARHVATLTDAGLRLKIRTGGVTAAAFPGEQQLAQALHTAVQGGVAFKLTAGLHDPVRHRDPATGFEHHGFLNVVLATARAFDGAGVPVVAAALADQDAGRVATAVGGLGTELAARIRRHFVSFGTCSITEPADGLLRHGLLPEDPR